jgi:tetratricopeptide (TPR) repeat protein
MKKGLEKLFIPALFFCAVIMCVSCANKEKNDEETWLLYTRAAAAYAQGHFEESADMLKPVPNFIPARILRAKALYFCGRGEEAEQLLRRTLRRNPGSGEASLFLARILREQNRDKEARYIAEALLRDNPEDIRALRLASDLASSRGDTEEAAALLDRAIEASAETALVYVDRARLKWIAGNGSSALEDLRRAELLLPWNTSLVRGIRDLKTVIAEAQK